MLAMMLGIAPFTWSPAFRCRPHSWHVMASAPWSGNSHRCGADLFGFRFRFRAAAKGGAVPANPGRGLGRPRDHGHPTGRPVPPVHRGRRGAPADTRPPCRNGPGGLLRGPQCRGGRWHRGHVRLVQATRAVLGLDVTQSGNSRAVSLLSKIRQDGVRLPTHPLTSRREPRSRRGVGCTRHPCRQASLRVSLRRGAGRPHPPAMGALSVIQWCAAPGPFACRQLGPVCQPCASPLRSRAVTGPAGPAPALWPHGRAAKAIRAVFAVRPRREFTGQRPVRS